MNLSEKLVEITDIQLIQELMCRYDHFVMAGMKVDTRGNEILLDYKGDENICVELCADIIVDLKSPEEDEEE